MYTAEISKEYRPVNVYGQEFILATEPLDYLGWVENRAWEPYLFTAFDSLLTPEHTCIDVGAWIGVTALYASRKCKEVYALEPDPVAFEIMCNNVARNQGNVSLENLALSGRSGTIRMGGAGLGFSCTRTSCADNAIEVPSLTLRDFVTSRKIEGPLVIKIDVEGSESEILRDTAFFQEFKPDVILSTHQYWWDEGGRNVDEQFAILNRVGKLYSHAYNIARGWKNLDFGSAYSEAVFTDRSLSFVPSAEQSA